MVVWASQGQDGSGWGVYGQRYDVSGVALGGEFRVNTTTADDQGNFTATATIPSDSSTGQHNVLATCTDPNGAALVATAPLRVTGGLAVTGANFIRLAIVMVVTLAVGLILILIGRRRRNRYEP